MELVEINKLIDNLKKLPGITTKQAERIVDFLITKNVDFKDELIDSIKGLDDNVYLCEKCNYITNKPVCSICSNKDRSKSILCIVSSSDDVRKIEDTNYYTGVYYVLNGEINVRNKMPLDKKSIAKFINLLKSNNFEEIIIATNWTPNGEATACFIRAVVKEIADCKVYRLAVGLPINSALNYADSETLKFSIKNKTKY